MGFEAYTEPPENKKEKIEKSVNAWLNSLPHEISKEYGSALEPIVTSAVYAYVDENMATMVSIYRSAAEAGVDDPQLAKRIENAPRALRIFHGEELPTTEPTGYGNIDRLVELEHGLLGAIDDPSRELQALDLITIGRAEAEKIYRENFPPLALAA